MPIIPLIITLAIVGVILWGVQQIPMNPTIQRVIVVVAIVCTLLWLLGQFSGYGPSIQWGGRHR